MQKILVIEDEEFVRANILELLEAEKFQAIEANNGEVGVVLAQQHLPDLIICDVMMPKLDGYGVLKALQQNPATAIIPFLFLTAKAETTDIRQGMNLGADDYITKPYEPADLLNSVTTRLNRNAVIMGRYNAENQRADQLQQQIQVLQQLLAQANLILPATQTLDNCLFSSNNLTERRRANCSSDIARSTSPVSRQLEANLDSPTNHSLLESDLCLALKREEFQLYYQPQVDLQTGQVMGAEALLRWHHPEQGLIPPSTFIPLAEATGFIIPLGEWVLWNACNQAKLWQSRIPHLASEFKIAVNLSARQFSQQNLSEIIIQTLTATRLDPKFLDLELTESILMQDVESAIDLLTDLRALGIQISIDDFGIGYSSLSYLQQFPFNSLKIDRCFIHEVNSDARKSAITQAIIQMAHSLNLTVIAEGVETEAELAFLCQHHCDAMQGYLFSRPLTAATFEELLLEGKCLPKSTSVTRRSVKGSSDRSMNETQ